MKAAAGAADRERHREAARAAWASIGRQDLIAEYLDPPAGKPPKGKRRKA
jgi:hypothetical protein